MTEYYREGGERAAGVRQLFSKIAWRYDCVNDIQSLGLHRRWKRRMVASFQVPHGGTVLDLACGTGDLAFRVAAGVSSARVLGGDYTWEMLRVARKRSRGFEKSPAWLQLDGLSLPFQDATMDGVTLAYGLRNMMDPARALGEILRILKSGGTLVLLDFGKPSLGWIRIPYYFFLKTIQPMIGWLFFQDAKTYRYIHDSLMRYPAREGVRRLLIDAGFSHVECEDLCLGTMTLHIARK